MEEEEKAKLSELLPIQFIEMYEDYSDYSKVFFDTQTNDRAAIILSMAKVDEILYNILKNALLPSDSKSDLLLDGYGPLSSLHSKIEMSFRLGIIDDKLYLKLKKLKKIRNDFAHSPKGCKLNEAPYAEQIESIVKDMKEKYGFEEYRKQFYNDERTPSIDLRILISFIIMYLKGTEMVITQTAPMVNHNTFNEMLDEVNQLMPKLDKALEEYKQSNQTHDK